MLRRLMRGLGIALILMPEPFTTPVGIALLGISYVLPIRSRVDKRRHLRGLIKLYLNYNRHPGHTGEVVHHRLTRRLQDLADMERLRQLRLPEKPVHHTIDINRLLFWYGAMLSVIAMAGDAHRPGIRVAGETAVRRHLLREQPARSDEASSRSDGKVVHHAIDSDRLLRRYGYAAGNRHGAAVDVKSEPVPHKLKQRSAEYAEPEQLATGQQSIYHALDIPRIQARYADTNRGLVTAGYYGWAEQVNAPEKSRHHSLDKPRLLQEYQRTPAFSNCHSGTGRNPEAEGI